MIDIKQFLRERHPLKAMILPETYYFEKISEFLDNKDSLRPTKTLFPPGVLFYGGSAIVFPYASFRFDHENSHGKNRMGFVSDFSGTLPVNLSAMRLTNSKKMDELTDGKRLHHPLLQYGANYPVLNLHNYTEIRKQARKDSVKDASFLDVRGLLSPA